MEDVEDNNNLESKRQYIYGPLAVFITTGLYLSDYQVYPMTSLLEEIKNLFTKIIKAELCAKYTYVDFNFMEVNIYLGGSPTMLLLSLLFISSVKLLLLLLELLPLS